MTAEPGTGRRRPGRRWVTALTCASAVACGTLVGLMLTPPAVVPVLDVEELCDESGTFLAVMTPRTGATTDPLVVALAGRDACRRMQAATRARIAAARYSRSAMDACTPDAENYTRLESCLQGRGAEASAEAAAVLEAMRGSGRGQPAGAR